MHIGFLTPEYITASRHDGGLANYIRKVGLALAKRGHRISVLVLSSEDTRWLDDSLFIREVKRFTWPSRLMKLRPLQPFLPALAQVICAQRLSQTAWRLHAENPFDVFQASSYMAPGLRLLRNGRVPLVCRVSSYTPLVRATYGLKRSFGGYLSDALELRQVLDADAAFAPSQFVANLYDRIKGFRPAIIRTPVDIQSVNLDPSFYDEHLNGVPYLLFFGTLSRIKGTDLLADIIPAVLAGHEDLHFVFIGRDDGLPDGQKLFEHIISQCPSYANRLFYHPAVPKAQIYPVVQHALGVLLPSRVDNYPNACLEAQSLGVPVVGTDNSSLEEMIIEGETGFLARNSEPKSLQAATERLLSMTADERHAMQARLLASIHMIQSEDRVGQLEAFYERVVNGKSLPSR